MPQSSLKMVASQDSKAAELGQAHRQPESCSSDEENLVFDQNVTMTTHSKPKEPKLLRSMCNHLTALERPLAESGLGRGGGGGGGKRRAGKSAAPSEPMRMSYPMMVPQSDVEEEEELQESKLGLEERAACAKEDSEEDDSLSFVSSYASSARSEMHRPALMDVLTPTPALSTTSQSRGRGRGRGRPSTAMMVTATATAATSANQSTATRRATKRQSRMTLHQSTLALYIGSQSQNNEHL